MSDLINRIRIAQRNAAEDIVIKHLEEQGFATKPAVPRVRPSDLEAQIASEHYFTAAEGVSGAVPMTAEFGSGFHDRPVVLDLLTFCVLVLKNGFTVTGESAVVSPELFDAKVGRDVAREAAINKLWPLMGFRLKDRLCAEAHAAESPDPEPGSGPL